MVTEPAAAAQVAALAAKAPATVRLAESVSLAVRVEPALLRVVRRSLHPAFAADVEADLWFGPLVGPRNVTGFVFREGIRSVLQSRLAARPADLAESWRLTERTHARASQLQRLDERMTWLLLRGDRPDDVTGELMSIIGALNGEITRADRLARWALRAVHRLPASVWQHPAATMLALTLSARFDGLRVLPAGRPAAIDVGHLAALLPVGTSRIPVGVRLRPDLSLEVSEPPAASAQHIRAPATDPLVLQVVPDTPAGAGAAVQVILDRGHQARIGLPTGSCVVWTAAGDGFRLFLDDRQQRWQSPVDLSVHQHSHRVAQRPEAAADLRPAIAALDGRTVIRDLAPEDHQALIDPSVATWSTTR